MPAGDGTGQGGQGPMSGRGAGFCAGYGMPGFMNPAVGRGSMGFGRGRGFGGGGRGWRHWYYATGMPGWMRAGMGQPFAQTPVGTGQTPAWGAAQEQEVSMLKAQAESLNATLQSIQARLDEIQAAQSGKSE